MSRREEGKGYTSNEECADALIQRIEDYMEKFGGRLITATRNKTNDTMISRAILTRKQKSDERQHYEHFSD